MRYESSLSNPILPTGQGICCFRHTPGQALLTDLGQTESGFTLLEADEPPGFGPPVHVHDDAAEAFYVLEGEYIIFIGKEERACPAGSFIYVPAGVEHGFRIGRVQSRKVNLYLPGAMVGYFEELASAHASGTPMTDDELARAAARRAMRVVGPVPEGSF